MRSFRWLASLLSVGVCAAVAAAGATSSAPAPKLLPAALQHRHDPIKDKHLRSDGTSTSSNWSGYAVTTSGITEVDGSWKVPALVGGSCVNGTDQYSSFWVGIDGYNSNTVEQTGTDSDCVNGQTQYYGWYEFYPHPAYYASLAFENIGSGDVLQASVTYNSKNRTFTTQLKDVTRGLIANATARMSAQRTSAEWIAEAPSGSGGVLAIANFDQVFFTSSHAQNARSPQSIDGFGNNVQVITMVQSNGAGASPSGLTNGTDFNVTYEGPGHFSSSKK